MLISKRLFCILETQMVNIGMKTPTKREAIAMSRVMLG
jgi:molybdenum cofactor biosynthesis enzyme